MEGFYKHMGWGERASRFPYFLWGMENGPVISGLPISAVQASLDGLA